MKTTELLKECEVNEFVGILHLRLDKFPDGKHLWRAVIVPDSPLDSLGSYPNIRATGKHLDGVVRRLLLKLKTT